MAISGISGGTLAALVGALGVGGFLWWKKSQAAQGATPCQKMVATAAAAGGYPTNDTLTKSVCGGIDSILDGGLAGVSKLPGVQVATTALGTVTHAIFGSGPTCPVGSKTMAPRAAMEKVPGIATTYQGRRIYSVCVKGAADMRVLKASDIAGIIYKGAGDDTAYVPYVNWSPSTPVAQVVPVNSPTNTTTALSRDGRARGGVTVS